MLPYHTWSVGCSRRNRVETEAWEKPLPPSCVFITITHPKGRSEAGVCSWPFLCADGLLAKGCVPLVTSGRARSAGLPGLSVKLKQADWVAASLKSQPKING